MREIAATKNFLSQLGVAITAFAENAKPFYTTVLQSNELPTSLDVQQAKVDTLRAPYDQLSQSENANQLVPRLLARN